MPSSQRTQTVTNSSPWWQRPCYICWIVLRFFWGTIVLGLALNALVSLAFYSRGTSLQSIYFWPMLDLIQHNIFLVGFFFLVLFGLTGLMWYGSRHGVSVRQEQGEVRDPTMRDRTNLLQDLEDEFGRRLSESLQVVAMKELGLQERKDVISSSSRLVSWRSDAPEERSLPLHTSIVEAYDKAIGRLLILGEPGTGKSTLLMELACELLNRAKQDPEKPIPLLVNLSSWAIEKLPFVTWLVNQVHIEYDLPRHLCLSWIDQNRLLFLLDGLDEVASDARPKCIEYINTFRREHLVPLVVCSRSHEYLMQAERLRLRYAVEVQPLIPEQVDDYLKRIGTPVAVVQATLQSNPILRDLVTTPLMLNAVILAYHGKTKKDLPHLGTKEDQQRQVFECYITRMLDQGTWNWHYSSKETRQWLIWLAQQMQKHHLSEFYLERLQSTWLPTKLVQGLYYCLLGPVVGLILGLIYGLNFGLAFGLVVALLFGWVFVNWSGPDKEPSEILSWSSSKFLQVSIIVPFVMLFIVLFIMLYSVLKYGLVFGLVFGLFVGLYCVLIFGLSRRPLDEEMRKISNQGIHNSGWNALRMGLFFGLFGTLFVGLLFGLYGKLFSGLFVGLSIGLVVGLFYGGASFLNHYLIRFLLYQLDFMPLQYVPFLEEATKRILLQRVGGGYRFIHPLFQEYFASLGKPSSPNEFSPPTK